MDSDTLTYTNSGDWFGMLFSGQITEKKLVRVLTGGLGFVIFLLLGATLLSFWNLRSIESATEELKSSNIAQDARVGEKVWVQADELIRQSVPLLVVCIALALVMAVVTVRVISKLFKKMEWQTNELSRVSWHLLRTQETTARRFSHELHDELGQSLTALKANLAAMNRDSRVEDSLKLVDESIQNIRQMSQLLRPLILDDFGLDASLNWLADGFTQRTGIIVKYQSNFKDRLEDEQETHLFRIAQEALTNIARHSGASEVDIELRHEGSRILLCIADNGKGFSQTKAPRGMGPRGIGQRGMGMTGMRARARSVGGELQVDSSGEKGVRIEVWTPFVSKA